MNEKAIWILLALEVAERLAKMAIELKQQSGMSDEDLLAAAEQKNAETRDRAQKFLASLQ